MTRSSGQGHFFKELQTMMWGIFCLFLIQSDAVKEEYKCSMEFDVKCITKVTWTIPEKYAQKGRPFTVSFLSPEGKTENAVLLHYVGYYYCEAAGDHTCDEGNNSTTVSKSTCVTGRQYMLTADGEPAISCTPAHSCCHFVFSRFLLTGDHLLEITFLLLTAAEIAIAASNVVYFGWRPRVFVTRPWRALTIEVVRRVNFLGAKNTAHQAWASDRGQSAQRTGSEQRGGSFILRRASNHPSSEGAGTGPGSNQLQQGRLPPHHRRRYPSVSHYLRGTGACAGRGTF